VIAHQVGRKAVDWSTPVDKLPWFAVSDPP
jgi:hypothetical protein